MLNRMTNPFFSARRSFNDFLGDAAPAMTAIHNMLADVCYTGFAVHEGHISYPLLAIIWLFRFPGSVTLLASNTKAAAYVHTHNNLFAAIIGTAQNPAQKAVNYVRYFVPEVVRAKSPGSFTLAFAAYTLTGAEVCREGVSRLLADPRTQANLVEMGHDVLQGHILKAATNPSASAFFQAFAGTSVVLGCGSYALSGLEIVKRHAACHHFLTNAGATISFPTAILNITNACVAGGPTSVRGTLLSCLSYLNVAQIVVRNYLHSKIDDRPPTVPLTKAGPTVLQT
jgi:hypothetical protein